MDQKNGKEKGLKWSASLHSQRALADQTNEEVRGKVLEKSIWAMLSLVPSCFVVGKC